MRTAASDESNKKDYYHNLENSYLQYLLQAHIKNTLHETIWTDCFVLLNVRYNLF